MSDIQTKLRSLIAEHLNRPEDQVVPEAAFQEDLGADSLDTVEICMAVEEMFLIEITDDEGDDALGPEGTFAKLVSLVEGKQKAIAL